MPLPAETMNGLHKLSPLRLMAISPSSTPHPNTSLSSTGSRYKITIDLPRNLTFTAVFPLAPVEVENLAHVQLLRLWEVLLEMKNEPYLSPFVDWSAATQALFEKEMVHDDLRKSIVVVEKVLRTKWNEPVAKEESVI